MTRHVTDPTTQSRPIGRSVLALFAGLIVNIVLSVATDFVLQVAGVLPHIGRGVMNDSQCALAATYRTIFSVFSSYIVARLAPYSPMGHALLGAAIGMVLATAGALATWNAGLGPHWYSVSLIVLALPTGWAGAKLWIAQKR